VSIIQTAQEQKYTKTVQKHKNQTPDQKNNITAVEK
jgi:hypothetical protein